MVINRDILVGWKTICAYRFDYLKAVVFRALDPILRDPFYVFLYMVCYFDIREAIVQDNRRIGVVLKKITRYWPKLHDERKKTNDGTG